MADQRAPVSLSVVSHGQGELVRKLITDLGRLDSGPLEVLLTLNIPETLSFRTDDLPIPVRVIRNTSPKGFGANHNAAFAVSRGGYFCIANPDIRLEGNPFPALIECLSDPRIGVVAPQVRSPDGSIEDSARRFPTFGILVAKLLRRALGVSTPPDYPVDRGTIFPDWVAGMFMLLRRETFVAAGGFDEAYFLYYEDVDLCARLRASGLEVAQVSDTHVTHAARRASHRNLLYTRWHVRSMLRFLRKSRRMQWRSSRA